MSQIKLDLAAFVGPQARGMAHEILKRRKAKLIMDFWTHPVTREIREGADNPVDTPNYSGTLNSVEGPANLFAYIGFEARDEDPIEPIMQQLESIKLGPMSRVGSSYVFDIIMPESSDIWDVTPMPWAEGRSWAEGIEKGISGVGYYLHGESDRSRSEGGIQSTNKLRGGKFTNIKYISELLRNFKKSLNDSTI